MRALKLLNNKIKNLVVCYNLATTTRLSFLFIISFLSQHWVKNTISPLASSSSSVYLRRFYDQLCFKGESFSVRLSVLLYKGVEKKREKFSQKYFLVKMEKKKRSLSGYSSGTRSQKEEEEEEEKMGEEKRGGGGERIVYRPKRHK